MKLSCQSLLAHANRLTLVAALFVGASIAVAADPKTDETQVKTSEKQPADPKPPSDPKALAKDAPPLITNTLPILVAFPKSTFLTTLEAGQDPFFPSSQRRLPKAPEPPKVKPPPLTPPTPLLPPAVILVPPPTPGVVPPLDLIGSAKLTLRGLSGTQARRVAVLHTGARSYDFFKGDSTLIRLPNDQQLKVRCVDIRERSALFEAGGETKELFLREGVF